MSEEAMPGENLLPGDVRARWAERVLEIWSALIAPVGRGRPSSIAVSRAEIEAVCAHVAQLKLTTSHAMFSARAAAREAEDLRRALADMRRRMAA